MSADRGPWIVAGMHRSGTSLLTSALAAGGVHLGDRLLSGDRHNAPGYFEDVDFLDLDRRMLAAACPSDDPGHADWGWTESERLDRSRFAAFEGEARELVADRASRGRPWGFKDPRATLLLDFWLNIAPEARFLLPYRLPSEVAESLQRLGAKVFLDRPDYGYRIWSLYNRHLLDFHARHPDRSVLVSTDAAVEDGRRFAEALRSRLGIEIPPDALGGRLAPGLFRRLSPDDPLIHLTGAAHPECFEILAALDRAAALPARGLWRSAPPRPHSPAREPRVSVVIPCYEDGELLLEAVASAERAIDVPFELLVIDDGSRDPRTLAILDLVAAAGYPVHHRPHRGLAAARNHGFEAARSAFVIPLDADNRLLPGFVTSAIAELEREPELCAVYGNRIEFGARQGRVEVGPFDVDRMVACNYVDACAVVRRQDWLDCGGYDEAMPLQGLEDWDLWLTMTARGRSLRWLPVPGFEYRVRPGSMLHTLHASPDLAKLEAYMLGKHHSLYLGSLRKSIEAHGASRRDTDETRSLLAAASEALNERTQELSRRTEELAGMRATIEALEEEIARGAAERLDLEAAHAALHRQCLDLHGWLENWRRHTTTQEASRTLRVRNLLVRVRSRLEGRPRAGPAEPCVIGATGGSGTRVFARLAARGGLELGTDRNEFEDSLPIERFLDAWLIPFWQSSGGEAPYSSPPGMDEAFMATFAEQIASDPAGALGRCGPRGWKSPRSLYLLPFLAQRFPDLRFLHVVRDGRDMALSANQLQLARYGTLMLSPAAREWTEAERSIALWSRINGWAADIGSRLGASYRRVRLEDLVDAPTTVTALVFRFFDLTGDARAAARLVEHPDSLGRWRGADPGLVARLEEIAGPTLERFGYRVPGAGGTL